MRNDPLERVETSYVDAQTLICLLKGYQNPRDWIWRQVKNGRLIRLKNGFFCISKKEALKPQIANMLYGPSYVSLQWALSFYGLIPERATTLTSITTRRNKEFRTPLGVFSYRFLSLDRYCLSVDLTNERFLIATPEKALIDFIHFFCEGETPQDLVIELMESHRFTEGDIKNLNFSLLKQIAINYKSPIIRLFITALNFL
jgi:predicted transcriptional regulator of viral defense system